MWRRATESTTTGGGPGCCWPPFRVSEGWRSREGRRDPTPPLASASLLPTGQVLRATRLHKWWPLWLARNGVYHKQL